MGRGFRSKRRDEMAEHDDAEPLRAAEAMFSHACAMGSNASTANGSTGLHVPPLARLDQDQNPNDPTGEAHCRRRLGIILVKSRSELAVFNSRR
jgi:hypothetical protein